MKRILSAAMLAALLLFDLLFIPFSVRAEEAAMPSSPLREELSDTTPLAPPPPVILI